MKKILVVLTSICIASSLILLAYAVKGFLYQLHPAHNPILSHYIALGALITLTISALIRRGIEIHYIRKKNYEMMNCINYWSGIICFPILPALFVFGMPILGMATVRESMAMHSKNSLADFTTMMNFFYNEFTHNANLGWFFWFTLIGTTTIMAFGVYLYILIGKPIISQKHWAKC